MTEFKEIIKDLKVQEVHFLPGEHDASLDNGKAFQEFFGPTHWTLDHKGVHFIALDNVSDPRGQIGEEQLKWLADDLAKLDKNQRIGVLTHRPLFDLAPDWDWATRDGQKALDLLMPFANVTVFYGHIHQRNDHMVGHIDLHGAHGLMYPLPAAHSVPKKAPISWDPAQPYKGLGWREIEAKPAPVEYALIEMPVVAKSAAAAPQVIKVVAKKYEFIPGNITLKKGVPVILEFTSKDVMHGFSCPDLNIRTDIEPGKTSQASVTPDKVGKFDCHCDVFCGAGHDRMMATITVTE
jgi:3',5'-cyclic AMP phosphodiesterase CpdA